MGRLTNDVASLQESDSVPAGVKACTTSDRRLLSVISHSYLPSRTEATKRTEKLYRSVYSVSSVREGKPQAPQNARRPMAFSGTA